MVHTYLHRDHTLFGISNRLRYYSGMDFNVRHPAESSRVGDVGRQEEVKKEEIHQSCIYPNHDQTLMQKDYPYAE